MTAKEKLEMAERQYGEVLEKHLENGVEFTSRAVYIDPEVEIAPGAVILPNCILRGATKIGPRCVIGPNTLLENTVVGAGSTVNASQCYDSTLGENNKIGPFTHVRVGTVTAEGTHLGAYVETKNAHFAEGNTVSHLTYIGDAEVGKYCNFGCGTVTCNYDGEGKYHTVIGDYAFIGCNTNLVAPVTVGDHAFTAAGSTIGADVPAGALGIERARQANVPGWGAKKLEKYVAKKVGLEAQKQKK
ncbi:MAG: UDP-N-acetylglucosamine diphosphorylase [Gemmiger sp.]|nr:UDP-N-acetylglucosamine diphosphorylase [Gemmiger sp.]